MLLGLSIRDVVLIDRLDISFAAGLSVLTGETGAGKSILLDSLGLALGGRSDSGLVRPGAAQLSVSAEFQPPPGHESAEILMEQAIEPGETLVLRRVVGVDGRSRAFVNDQPVSVGLLRRLGDCLVEIHGQFEGNRLFDSAAHRGFLDSFAQLDDQTVKVAWQDWRDKHQARRNAEVALAKAGADEELLRYSLNELNALDPKPGEEEALASRRSFLMHGEKLVEAVNSALEMLTRSGGIDTALLSARRALERVADKAEGRLEPVLETLDRAALETSEARDQIEKLCGSVDLDPTALERVEQRLFTLRGVARKHAVTVEELPRLLEKLRAACDSLEEGGAGIARLASEEDAARKLYITAARVLSEARQAAAVRLDQAVAKELPPLKLDQAVFKTVACVLPEDDWSERGLDSVAFEISTIPGMKLAPLAKIASGGERSRFMLALKVVLASAGAVPSLIFDEVDSGIGGAVAAAVGERLARLAETLQVLVVTHSPQVAARGDHHWHVAKLLEAGVTVTRVAVLGEEERREEVARMLAGAQITDEARAAAGSLLGYVAG